MFIVLSDVRSTSKKRHVIASQCAHWRGNPVDFRGILGNIPQI